VILFLYYLSFYIKVPSEYVTFEHKFILALSAALILFNDPFYGFTLLNPGNLSVFMSTLYITGFIALLVYFWMVMFQRIYKEPLRVDSKLMNLPVIMLGIVLFILLTSTALSTTILRRFDPGVNVYEELSK
jgi:hypothetical protein